ncbi:unnamed protein product, partial [Allacma fusca]
MRLDRAKELCFEQIDRDLLVLRSGIKDGLVDTETPFQSISFKGRRTVCQWQHLKDDINSLS